MVCDGCSSRVEEALAKMAGVKKVRQRSLPPQQQPQRRPGGRRCLYAEAAGLRCRLWAGPGVAARLPPSSTGLAMLLGLVPAARLGQGPASDSQLHAPPGGAPGAPSTPPRPHPHFQHTTRPPLHHRAHTRSPPAHPCLRRRCVLTWTRDWPRWRWRPPLRWTPLRRCSRWQRPSRCGACLLGRRQGCAHAGLQGCGERLRRRPWLGSGGQGCQRRCWLAPQKAGGVAGLRRPVSRNCWRAAVHVSPTCVVGRWWLA